MVPSFFTEQRARTMWLSLAFFITVAVQASATAVSPSKSLEQKCAYEVGAKLVDCLPYAKGDEATPSRRCCTSATDIRDTDPACFCYVIQQTYEEKPSFKVLGLQLPRLLQLPATCRIPNSNITDCPRLLNIPPTSPDYAIFNGSEIATANISTAAGQNSAGMSTLNRLRYTFAMAASTVSCAVLLSTLPDLDAQV